MNAEKELKENNQIFVSVIRSVEERKAEVDAEFQEKQKAAERRANKLIDELQQENMELQRRNAELAELRNTEDHLHLLQVIISLKQLGTHWFHPVRQPVS